MTSPAVVRRADRAPASVATLFVVFGVVDATWASRIPLVRERLGLSELELSLALTGPAFGLLVAAAATSALVRRHGSDRVARGAALSAAAGLALPALAWDLGSLVAVLALWGCCLGALDITMNDQGSALERRAGRSLMSRLHATYSLAVLAFASVGSLAAGVPISPLVHFVAVAVGAGALALVGTRRLVTDTDADTDPPPRAAEAAGGARGGSRTLAAMAAIAFCGFIAEGAAINWSGVLLHEVDGASLAVAPLALSGFSVGMVVGRGGGDALIERLGHRTLAWRAATLAAVGMVLAAGVRLPGVAIAGYALLGLGLSVLVPIAFALAARTPDLPPVRAIARLTVAGYAGLFVGPPVVGLVSAALGLRQALLGVAALLVVAATAARIGARPGPRDP